MPRAPCRALPLIAITTLAASGARAELPPLSSEAIRDTVSGATVHLDTPLGTVVPLHFLEDGSITGSAGSLAFHLGASADRGRWWVAAGRLCWRWSRWFDGEQSCMQIRRKGARVEWRREDGRSGTATIVHKPSPKPAPPPPSIVAVAPPAAAPRPAYALGGVVELAERAALPPAPAPAIVARPSAPRPDMAPAKQSKAADAPQAPPPVAAARPAPDRTEPSIASPAAPRPPAGGTEAPRAPAPAAAAQVPSQVRLHHPSPLPSAYRVVGVADGDVLNMRTHPFHAAPIVSGIPPNGRGVHRLGPCQGMWCLVRWQARTGWVNAIYLDSESARARGPGVPPIR